MIQLGCLWWVPRRASQWHLSTPNSPQRLVGGRPDCGYSVEARTSPPAFSGPRESIRSNQRRAAKDTGLVEPRHSRMGLHQSRAPPEWAGKEHLRRNKTRSNHRRVVAAMRHNACSHRRTGKRPSALFPLSARHIADRSGLFGARSYACCFQIPDGDHGHDG